MLQHAATCCNMLQQWTHAVVRKGQVVVTENKVQRTVSHCNMLQHTATVDTNVREQAMMFVTENSLCSL